MNAEKNVLLLKGQSQYNVLREACDKVGEGFSELGYNLKILDLVNPEFKLEDLSNEIKKDYEFVFSFQALGTETHLYDSLEIPFFGWIVDPPVYHLHRINNIKNKKIVIGCIDKSHVEYIDKYKKNVKNAVYLPHAGFVSKNIVPYNDRKIDVLFSGGYTEPEERMKQIKNQPKVFYDMIMFSVEMIKDNNQISAEEAMKSYFKKINFEYTEAEFMELNVFIGIIDTYIRVFYRDQIIRTLLENNIRVTVVGKGWDKFETQSSKNLDILSDKGMDIIETTDLIAKAKIVLNIAPTYNNGMHERILTAMLNETICFTLYNDYLSEIFEDKKEIMYFKTNEKEKFVDDVKNILNDQDKAVDIVKNARIKAEKGHAWKTRAEEIINIINNI